jgi:hypothetical protein
MKRFVPSLIGLALLVALVATAASPAAASGPNFDKDNFHHPTRITNKFMPLDPGTTFVYQGTKDGAPASDNVIVTHQTKKIIGVTTVVVRDQAFDENGKLVEDTFDWYAQDDAGNVWYFGEDTKELDPDTGQVISTEGSWQAGTRGARPGIIMEARPKVGDTYQQEFAAPVAEDMAQVLSLHASVCVPFGCFHGNLLKTKEWSPLEPGVVENKYYAPGVGNLKAIIVKGGQEESHLVKIIREED